VFADDDSRIPIASSAVIARMIAIAKRSICECARSIPPCDHTTFATLPQAGSEKPKLARNVCTYPDHAAAVGATLMPYSRIRSQPMIQATNSPSVAYAYVYALPAIGTIAASSA